MCKLLVFGSRSLRGQEVKRSILRAIEQYGATEIVTAGEPAGVCEAARDLCRQEAIPLKLHFVNRKAYAGGIFEHRCIAALSDCDQALFIHDGKSRGTSGELACCKKNGRAIRVSADDTCRFRGV